jgi:superfamily II helicase
MTCCLDIGAHFTCTFTLILQDHKRPEKNRVGRMLSWNAESYHAGLSAVRRKQVQKAFMSGKSLIFNCFTSTDLAAGLTLRAAIFLSMLMVCLCSTNGGDEECI